MSSLRYFTQQLHAGPWVTLSAAQSRPLVAELAMLGCDITRGVDDYPPMRIQHPMLGPIAYRSNNRFLTFYVPNIERLIAGAAISNEQLYQPGGLQPEKM